MLQNQYNILKYSCKQSYWYDYGARFYDPQICRFISVDKLASTFPWWTPYQYAGNTPVWAIDLDGLEPLFSTSDFYNALRQGEYALHGPKEGERQMDIWKKGAANAAITALSFAAPISRLGFLGYSAATVKNFNTTLAAFEVIGVEIPLLRKATSDLIGGDVQGNILPTQLLYDAGMNRTANTIDLSFDIFSLFRGGKPESAAELLQKINDAVSTGLDLQILIDEMNHDDNAAKNQNRSDSKNNKSNITIKEPENKKKLDDDMDL